MIVLKTYDGVSLLVLAPLLPHVPSTLSIHSSFYLTLVAFLLFGDDIYIVVVFSRKQTVVVLLKVRIWLLFFRRVSVPCFLVRFDSHFTVDGRSESDNRKFCLAFILKSFLLIYLELTHKHGYFDS